MKAVNPMMTQREVQVVRGLAAQLADVASLPIQREKAELWRRLNRLEPVRPMVWLMMSNDAPWAATGVDDLLQCTDPFLRGQEQYLRRQLYQWEHQAADLVFDGIIRSPLAIDHSGWGIEAKWERPDHFFGASRFLPVMTEDDLERIAMPEIHVDWEETERHYQRRCELYGGLLRVEKTGFYDFWFDMFDHLIQWRGVEQALVDMLDRPEWVHRVMERMTQHHLSELDQYESLGALSLNNASQRVGSGGLGFTDELPQADFDGQRVRTRDMWGHATTQIFVDVSPAMHDEFALQYEARLLSRFGLSNYGCCEPLHNKVDIVLKRIPNVRRVSMSPWADVAKGAAALGDRAIFSYKPNPAVMAGESWDPESIRADLRAALRITRAHGCIVEILLKDLHTCNGRPERMADWTRVAVEVAEEFAY